MRNEFAIACGGLALLTTIIVAGGRVSADNPSSHTNQHKFSDVFLALKPGDEVTFVNTDGVIHRLVSATPDYELTIGELQPGVSKSLVFNHKGVVDLGCSMHPEMKMTVFVRTPPKSPGFEDVDKSAYHATINLLSAS